MWYNIFNLNFVYLVILVVKWVITKVQGLFKGRVLSLCDVILFIIFKDIYINTNKRYLW